MSEHHPPSQQDHAELQPLDESTSIGQVGEINAASTVEPVASIATFFEALGHSGGNGVMSVCFKTADDEFTPVLASDARAAARAAQAHRRGNVYFGVNRLREGVEKGRGRTEDVVALNVLSVDLDLYSNKVPNTEVANAIIDDITNMLGATPVAIVHSGHGLQVHWAVDGFGWEPGDEASREIAKAVLGDFGERVTAIAASHNAKVDDVFDLTHMMRVPGTMNIKPGMEPIRATLLELDINVRRLRRDELVGMLRAQQQLAGQVDQPIVQFSDDVAADEIPTVPMSTGEATVVIEADAVTDIEGVLEQAILRGDIQWTHLLDPGWTQINAPKGGWSTWARPDYDSPAKNPTAAGGGEALGSAVFKVHSTSVPHLDTTKAYRPLALLVACWFDGDVEKAMSALRELSKQLTDTVVVEAPFAKWPDSLLEAISRVSDVNDTRPEIDVGKPAEVVEFLRDNLGHGALAGIYRRGGDLVFAPEIDESGYHPGGGPDESPKVLLVDASLLRAIVQQRCRPYRWVKRAEGQEKRRQPLTIDVCSIAINSLAFWRDIPTLRYVTHTPIMRPDGTVLDTPGYDPELETLYLPDPDLTVAGVPDNPTEEDIEAARALLLGFIDEFRFVTDSDRANYLGALMTPILRHLLPPPYPLIILNAPSPGSGKSLLADVIRILHGGEKHSELPKDDEEVGKVITSVLNSTTAPVVIFDNASGVIRSARLSAFLTSKSWSGRILGKSQNITVPNDRLFITTGNNVSVGGDMHRRALWCTIDPNHERPWERTEFKIQPLADYVQEHRGKIQRAMLVLARAWVVAGRPQGSLRSDDYGNWQGAIAGILANAGITGEFMGGETDRAVIGIDDDEMREFLAAIDHEFQRRTFTAAVVLEKCVQGTRGFSSRYELTTLGGSLPTYLQAKVIQDGPKAATRALGGWFRKHQGRYAQGLTVRNTDRKNRKGDVEWRIDSADAGSAGSAESASDSAEED